jgi:hypothetical protein
VEEAQEILSVFAEEWGGLQTETSRRQDRKAMTTS